jgi:hypothetical protein
VDSEPPPKALNIVTAIARAVASPSSPPFESEERKSKIDAIYTRPRNLTARAMASRHDNEEVLALANRALSLVGRIRIELLLVEDVVPSVAGKSAFIHVAQRTPSDGRLAT